MTSKDALKAICEQLDITEQQALGWLEYLFEEGYSLEDCHVSDPGSRAAALKTGKRKLNAFVKAALQHGLLTEISFVVPTVELLERGNLKEGEYDSLSSALSGTGTSSGTSTSLRSVSSLTSFVHKLNMSEPEKIAQIWTDNTDIVVERDFTTVEEDLSVRRARAAESAEWEAKAAEAYKRLWFPEMVQEIFSLQLAKSKSGEVSWPVVLKTVYEPVLRLQFKFRIDRDLIEKALQLTLDKGIGNVMYAVAAAKSLQEDRNASQRMSATLGSGPKDVFYTDEGLPCSRLDTWCLDDPKYREAYIATFGVPEGME